MMAMGKTPLQAIWAFSVIWLAVLMDGHLDRFHPTFAVMRGNIDMALYWAVQEALKWVP